MKEFIKSLFSSDPNSMSSSRFMAFLLVITNCTMSLWIVFFKNALVPDVFMIAEATALLVITVLSPAKVIEAITALRKKL